MERYIILVDENGGTSFLDGNHKWIEKTNYCDRCWAIQKAWRNLMVNKQAYKVYFLWPKFIKEFCTTKRLPEDYLKQYGEYVGRKIKNVYDMQNNPAQTRAIVQLYARKLVRDYNDNDCYIAGWNTSGAIFIGYRDGRGWTQLIKGEDFLYDLNCKSYSYQTLEVLKSLKREGLI